MIASAANDAMRLLRAINIYQAHGCVGATVFTFSPARVVGSTPQRSAMRKRFGIYCGRGRSR
jgi:hypothetical protein